MNKHPVLQWSATAVTLIGAILTAAALDPWNVYCANLGSILWLIWAVRMRSHSLMAVNAGLMLIYFGGIIRSIVS